ncbi:hypothetical protein KI387_032866, partial [Taxus chinensis]
MGLRDSILIEDHKKGFSIKLDACAYFREEVDMCGSLNKKVVSKSKNTSKKPCGKNKCKSYSDKHFKALVDKQNEEPIEEKIYPFKDNDEPPKKVDLTLPPYPTWMEDASK